MENPEDKSKGGPGTPPPLPGAVPPPLPEPEPGAKDREGGTGKNRKDTDPFLAAELGIDNRSRLEKISGGARKILRAAFDKVLYKIPGVSRIVGKMDIAYDQFWIDRNEKKAADLKIKMSGFDSKIDILDQSKKDIESLVEDMKREGYPPEKLLIRMKKVDQEKAALLAKKDKVQSKFEKRQDKVKLYSNERDQIADKLIGRYSEKLEPLENELAKMERCKDDIDVLEASLDVRWKSVQAKIDQLEKRKENLGKIGLSKKEIKEMFGAIDDCLGKDKEKIAQQRDSLQREKAKIEKGIAKANAKANPYRDKREEFVRVKNGRPIDMNVSERSRSKVFSGREDIEASRRDFEEGAGGNGGEGGPNPENKENSEKGSLGDYLSKWNEHIEKELGKKNPMMLDQEVFLRSVRLSGKQPIEFADFKNILMLYYRARNISNRGEFERTIGGFEKKVGRKK